MHRRDDVQNVVSTTERNRAGHKARRNDGERQTGTEPGDDIFVVRGTFPIGATGVWNSFTQEKTSPGLDRSGCAHTQNAAVHTGVDGRLGTAGPKK